jgi:hypothetical protein
MQINQDTFKEGKLDFGMRYSAQRNNIYDYRHNVFNDLILEDYPEYYLMLQGDRATVRKLIFRIAKHINFKYKDKIACSLAYDSLESVNSNEFEVIIKRFGRYLKNHLMVKEELKQAFIQEV